MGHFYTIHTPCVHNAWHRVWVRAKWCAHRVEAPLMVLMTTHFLSLRLFAGVSVIHHGIQHDQGYPLHISYTPGKQIKKKKLIKKSIN
jgi:hypothetical protein